MKTRSDSVCDHPLQPEELPYVNLQGTATTSYAIARCYGEQTLTYPPAISIPGQGKRYRRTPQPYLGVYGRRGKTVGTPKATEALAETLKHPNKQRNGPRLVRESHDNSWYHFCLAVLHVNTNTKATTIITRHGRFDPPVFLQPRISSRPSESSHPPPCPIFQATT